MIKLKDDVSGGVFPDGRISKPLTDHDRAAPEDGRRGLPQDPDAKPGPDAGIMFMTPLRGTHPSGTVRIGDDARSRTCRRRSPGLYVCDASVFPEALARPTVLTIIGLGKRLAKHLAASADLHCR